MTNTDLKEIKKRFYQTIEDDITGKNSPIELVKGCYECGEQIDEDGVWSFIEKALLEQRENILRDLKQDIEKYKCDFNCNVCKERSNT